MASTINEADLVCFTRVCSAVSSIWSGSLVVGAGFTHSILQEFMSQCAWIRAASFAVCGCSGKIWAFFESGIWEKSSGSITTCWNCTCPLVWTCSLISSAVSTCSFLCQDLVDFFTLIWKTEGVLLLLHSIFTTTTSSVV